MIATFPFSWLCTSYGARYVFFLSGMASAISTAIIPPAANLGFGWFIFVRVFQVSFALLPGVQSLNDHQGLYILVPWNVKSMF